MERKQEEERESIERTVFVYVITMDYYVVIDSHGSN